METGAPSLSKVVTMVLFALSCVGLLLFLWLSFGGTLPFNPQGYEFKVSFANADQLATQADVRIAGVSVGQVIAKQLDPQGNRTIATIQLDNKFAPIHSDATAILRMKTILGETYVEITPGSPNAPPIPDGGMLARGQVQNAVQLSDIFNAFDPTTRHAFQVWQQELAKAVAGNDQNLNAVLGNLPTFAADTSDILKVLDIEHTSVVSLLQNGETVFAALSQNQATLRNLITSAESTFAETAANNNALADTFHVFPTFLTETRLTMARLQSFSSDADPLIKELIPVAQDLGPTLHAVQVLSPNLERFFTKLGPLITVSKTGLPAVRDVIRGARPLLGSVGTFLEQLNPILDWLSLHQQLISDFISNGATGISAKTDLPGTEGSGMSADGSGLTCQGIPCGHYLRQFQPQGAETAGIYQQRDANNRGDTYPPSLWLADPNNFKLGNFDSWDCKNAGISGAGSVAAKNPNAGASGGTPACWVAPQLVGPNGQAPLFQIPHIQAATYSSK